MILGLIVLLGLLVRGAVLWRLPEVHYDEAVNGLMARHILQGQFPAFYWGQDYAGTLASFLMSMPFVLVDSSVTTLRLVPLGFSLLLMPLSYRVARAAYDEPTARLAMLYAALPPVTLLYLGVTAKDPYPEIPILGLLLLLLAIRLTRDERGDPARAFVLGLVAGIAWWTQLLLAAYLVTAGAFVVFRRGPGRLASEGVTAVAGFGLGSLPFWVYNLSGPATSLDLIRGAPPGEIAQNLSGIIQRDLPLVLGASAAWPTPAANRAVSLAIGLVYLPAGAVLLSESLRALWRRRPSLPAHALLTLTGLAVILVDAASPYRGAGGPKYLIPLYGVLPALLAHYTMTIRRALGLAAGVLLMCVLVGINVQDNVLDLLNSFQPTYLEDQSRPPTRALIDFLRSHEISRVYAHFRISLKLTFDTREEIVASDWHGFRSPAYLEEVERAPRVALVAHRTLELPDPDRLEENLTALGGTFSRHDVDGFVVFYDFRPPPPSRPIPAASWSGRGVPRAEDSGRAYDRDGGTWWGSGEPQRPGLAYELDLGHLHRLTGVSLHPGPVLEGAPRGVRVEVSADGRSWTAVVRVDAVLPGLHWAGSHPRLDRSGRVRVGFPAVEGRYLRIIQTGRDAYFWWSIGEIFLDEEEPVGSTGSPGQPALEEGERLEHLARWEFVGASPVARGSWRFRPGVDWDGILGAYRRASRADPELEEAHHRLAVVLSRLEIPPPGDPRRGLAFERAGAWRLAAEEYEAEIRRSPWSRSRSSGWEARLRVARRAGEMERAREVDQLLRTEFTPPIPSGVAFGRQLTFLGLGLEPQPAAPGQTLRLQAYWKALGPLGADYQVAFAFNAADGKFASGRRPLSGRIPPPAWLPGETVKEAFAIDIPPGTPPGRYEVRLSVRERQARHALRVWRFGLPTPSREATVGLLEIVPR